MFLTLIPYPKTLTQVCKCQKINNVCDEPTVQLATHILLQSDLRYSLMIQGSTSAVNLQHVLHLQKRADIILTEETEKIPEMYNILLHQHRHKTVCPVYPTNNILFKLRSNIVRDKFIVRKQSTCSLKRVMCRVVALYLYGQVNFVCAVKPKTNVVSNGVRNFIQCYTSKFTSEK